MAKRSPAAPSAAEHADKTASMLSDMQAEMNEMFKDVKEGVSRSLSSASTLSQVDVWTSTRSLVVDKVIAGGRPEPCSLLPFGRQTEISGLPGTGKTTLCAQIAAEVQAKGGFVVVTDTEDRIDHPYWRSLGVDTDRIMNLSARTLEEVFERQYMFIAKSIEKWPGVPILMLWDSLGGTSTDSIIEETDARGAKKKDSIMERAKKAMMVKAKLISAGMEIINPMVSKSKVAYVYTNTLYQKPDVDYGDPWETPGGNKKNFFATLRLRLRVTSEIKEEDDNTGKVSVIGQWVEVKALKNSMSPVKITLPAAVMGGKGYSDAYSIWSLGTGLGVINRPKGTSWSTWTTPAGEEVKFQGFNGFCEKVEKHAEYPLLVEAVSKAL